MDDANNNDEPLVYTGERLMPGCTDMFTYWDHIYRYRFALQYVRGKRVLDVASGEGYGAHALHEFGSATTVLGLDCAFDACRHAAARYSLNTICATATKMPLANRCLDVIVSFETIEHIEHPAEFVAECARLLTPDGVFIVSTPNKVLYNAGRTEKNPFHCAEMTEDEFHRVLAPCFEKITFYGQRPAHSRWWQRHAFRTKGSIWMRNPLTQTLLRRGLPEQVRADLDCPHYEAIRRDAVTDIGRKEWPWASYGNPFAVYKRSLHQDDMPYYFLAVCRL
jgi:SAM-dependent methyltransferase